MEAAVVVPTYNEAARVERVVAGILDQSCGVVVVDDASPDGTGRIADELANQHSAVQVVHRGHRTGLGHALAAGHEAALATGASIVCQMDADGSHDPRDIGGLLQAIDAGADVAIGSRYVPGGSNKGLSPLRAVLSRGGNWYARVALGIGTRDSTSGFRAYRADVLKVIGARAGVALGYAFQIEMAWRAHQTGFVVADVPITFHSRVGGSSKMSPAIPIEALWLVTRWGVSRLPAAIGGGR